MCPAVCRGGAWLQQSFTDLWCLWHGAGTATKARHLPWGRRGPGFWTQLGRTWSCWSWTPALGPQGPRSRRAKVVGSVFCLSKLAATPASLSLRYLRSPNGQPRAHQLSWLPQEPPGVLPSCRLSSSQAASLIRVLSTAAIRVKAMPRQHMPASSPHSRVFSWQVLCSTGLGPRF